MKKFIFLLSLISILGCSSENLDFQSIPPEDYKTIINDEIGYEFAVPERLEIIPQSLTHIATNEPMNVVVIREEEPGDYYFSDGAIMIFSAPYPLSHLKLPKDNNWVDYVSNELDKRDAIDSNSNIIRSYKKFEYIDKDSKNIGFYKHVYLEEKVEGDEFYSDIFSIYYIFDPEKRNSFYITCTVGTYSVDGKPVEKHSEKTISECKNIIQSARPK